MSEFECYSDAWEPSMSDEGSWAESPAKPAPKKAAKKTSKTSAASKKKKEVLAEVDENVAPMETTGLEKEENEAGEPAPAAEKRSVEDTYKRMSQLEHILHRPDTYIGSTTHMKRRTYVLVPRGENEAENEGEDDDGEDDDGASVASSSSSSSSNVSLASMLSNPSSSTSSKASKSMAPPMKFVEREVTYPPGLMKCVDELLVNAADHKQRDPSMKVLKVVIDQEAGTISVMNDGSGIPVEMHTEENMYVPELIFGHLLTSSNYDDSEEKVVGGRNGFGAKLANIFSKRFVVETADGSRKRQFKQTFYNNMSERDEPTITKCKARDNWTKITFEPDLARFGMESLEDDVVAMMAKRAYDIAGSNPGLKVYLNDQRLPVKNFSEYVDMYLGDVTAKEKVYAKVSDRWEVCVAASDGEFKQVSFVNSIWTAKGGKHVDHVADQVVKAIRTKLNTGKNKMNVQPFQIKSHLFVFVKSLIVNPSFDSQTKEELTTKVGDFGSRCALTDGFMKKVLKSGIKEAVSQWAKFRAKQKLGKTNGKRTKRVTGVPKLEDANKAGTAKGKDCTLILTEGDSAKALAVAGLSVVGRDYYGVFPLRGKLLNVREANTKQILGNAEISALNTIMGFKHGFEYDETSIKTLRYGSIMIMTDQDVDGSHIKGLVINYIHHFWPSLLKVPGFLREFITPIVKATKGRVSNTFYTLPEYETFKEELGGTTKGWSIKYYKGLGTSKPKEAKEYFADLATHVKDFVYNGEEDDEVIDLAFSKKKITERKAWLSAFEPGTFLDMSVDIIPYTDFVNKELILFSLEDNMRSIPSQVDGLKPGQRKILHACFKRDLKKEIKVAQLAGYVAEHSAYHHGEASLASTIVGMAQDYTGSNNINLLLPNGQFGTRHQGGKDAASPRYIFTALNPITRYLFPKADDPLLEYQEEEGMTIEPTYFIPILPLMLINGADGIGTGWSTSVPNYSPYDCAERIRKMIEFGEDTELDPLAPWYRDFVGTIEPRLKKGKLIGYHVTGKIEQISETMLRIDELPIRVWTQSTKELLESYIDPPKKAAKKGGKAIKQDSLIKGYTEYHTDTTVCFEIELTPEQMAAAVATGLEKMFKISTTISVTNMHAFDKDCRIRKFTDPRDILRDFFSLRLQTYIARKEYMTAELDEAWRRLDNKARFVSEVISGELVVSGVKKADLVQTLFETGYTPFPKKPKAGSKAARDAAAEEGEDEDDDDENASVKASDYNYLLSMAIWSLTHEKQVALVAERDAKEEELKTLLSKRPEDLWLEDLDAFETAFTEITSSRSKDQAFGTRKTKGGKKANNNKKKKKANDWDDDGAWGEESDSADGILVKPKAVKVSKVAKKKGPTRKRKKDATKTPVKTPPVATQEEEEVVDVSSLSLVERVNLRIAQAGGSSEVEAVSASSPKAKPVVEAATPPPKRQKTKITGAAAAAKKGGKKKKAAPKKSKAKRVVSDSDDDEDAFVESMDEASPVKSRPARGGRRAAARVNYAELGGGVSSDGDFEDEVDDEDVFDSEDAFDSGDDFESDFSE